MVTTRSMNGIPCGNHVAFSMPIEEKDPRRVEAAQKAAATRKAKAKAAKLKEKARAAKAEKKKQPKAKKVKNAKKAKPTKKLGRQSAYTVFNQMKQKQIREKHPSWDFPTVSKEVSRQWGKLSPSEKARFQTTADTLNGVAASPPGGGTTKKVSKNTTKKRSLPSKSRKASKVSSTSKTAKKRTARSSKQ